MTFYSQTIKTLIKVKNQRTFNNIIVFNFLLLILFSVKGFSQEDNYNCYIKNIKQTNEKTLEFDVFLEWTGRSSQKLTFFQAGINFNYDGMAGGGVITGTFKPGSVDPSLPNAQQKLNWNINQSSKQIRLKTGIAMDSVAVSIPPAPGFRLGTFVMTNTVPFSKSSKPDFNWSFATGSSTMTKTMVTVYLNGTKTPKDITNPKNHLVKE